MLTDSRKILGAVSARCQLHKSFVFLRMQTPHQPELMTSDSAKSFATHTTTR